MNQGVQERADLPQWFVEWADAQLGEPLNGISWDDSEPNVFHMHSDSRSLKIKTARSLRGE